MAAINNLVLGLLRRPGYHDVPATARTHLCGQTESGRRAFLRAQGDYGNRPRFRRADPCPIPGIDDYNVGGARRQASWKSNQTPACVSSAASKSIGLHLSFYTDGRGAVHRPLPAQAGAQGYPGHLHGGIIQPFWTSQLKLSTLSRSSLYD